MPRRFFKRHAARKHALVILVKIIGPKEKPNTTATLLADGCLLCRAIGLSQDEPATSARRFDGDPPFVPLVDVFGQREIHHAAVKGNRRVVIRHNKRHRAKTIAGTISHERPAPRED